MTNTSKQFQHSEHGNYNDQPHAEVDLLYNEWEDAVKDVVQYQVETDVAWVYDDYLYVWGDELDDSFLRQVAAGVRDAKQQHTQSGMFKAAQAARSAATKIEQTDIHPPGERIITH